MLLCGITTFGLILTIWLLSRPGASVATAETETAPTPAETAQPPAAGMSIPLRAGAKPPPGGKPPPEWGIEMLGLYPSAGGRALDLRYKVLDIAKAALLPNEPGHIYLVDEATGAATGLPNSPRTGSIPQNPQKLQVGRSYSLALPNPGGRFKRGSTCTVVIGNLRAEHLVVQ